MHLACTAVFVTGLLTKNIKYAIKNWKLQFYEIQDRQEKSSIKSIVNIDKSYKTAMQVSGFPTRKKKKKGAKCYTDLPFVIIASRMNPLALILWSSEGTLEFLPTVIKTKNKKIKRQLIKNESNNKCEIFWRNEVHLSLKYINQKHLDQDILVLFPISNQEWHNAQQTITTKNQVTVSQV